MVSVKVTVPLAGAVCDAGLKVVLIGAMQSLAIEIVAPAAFVTAVFVTVALPPGGITLVTDEGVSEFGVVAAVCSPKTPNPERLEPSFPPLKVVSTAPVAMFIL